MERTQLEQTAMEILNSGQGVAIATYHYSTGETRQERVRLCKSTLGDPCIKQRRKKNWGTRIASIHSLIDLRPVFQRVTPELQWEKQVKRAIHMLEGSGLWTDFLQRARLCLLIGLPKLKQAQMIYHEFEKPEAEKLAKYKAIDPRLTKVFEIDRVKREMIDSELFLFIHLKIKKMFFGAENQTLLAAIAKAMKAKTPYSCSARAQYDVGFEYHPEKNKAFYSEEFRNCGNGHYYIALNETHAMFVEDD
jgi:hypothetical protein